MKGSESAINPADDDTSPTTAPFGGTTVHAHRSPLVDLRTSREHTRSSHERVILEVAGSERRSEANRFVPHLLRRREALAPIGVAETILGRNESSFGVLSRRVTAQRLLCLEKRRYQEFA